jgi:hypothetical protein
MPRSKVLLTFLSAYHPSRWHYRQILRKQCLQNSPIDYKFVFGDEPFPGDRERCGIPDDEFLHAPGSDDKKFLHLKVKASCEYALANGYDFLMRCTDDCWVYPDRILEAGLQAFDLAGAFSCKFSLGGTFKTWFKYLNHPHGGAGIWLSRKAMEMLVAAKWDEHYLDSWPARIDLGFGLAFPRPDWLWDDHFIGEVLQGNLAYDDPLREQPMMAYQANGISVFEDEMLFWNDDPKRPLTIHDPGVVKENPQMETVKRQVRHRNIAQAMRAARVPEAEIKEASSGN